uniref:Coenzyme Q-binding protein COQ10 START domain-containing protein n=1 Tax=Kalanchoe fedtschenkoi TaxID=63787 RepID=A0A7N1A2Z7_KALFE
MSAISAASSSSMITSSRSVDMKCKSQLVNTVTYRCRLKQQPAFALGAVFFRYPHGLFKLRSNPKRVRRVAPVMQWQDCTVKMEVDVPASVAYNCYADRESIPKWMPFISKVKNLEDKPELSRWSLKYKAFGQDIEFSWLARNMQPTPNQKIHWRSMEGLPNRGAVRFFPRGPSSCLVEALKPYLEKLLMRGLERFSNFAKSYQDQK